MVTLEKITYQPLIEHLKESKYEYDHKLTQYELKYGVIPADTIFYWMTKVVQPIVKAVSDSDKEVVSQVTKTLFDALIDLLKKGKLLAYEKEFTDAWMLSIYFKDVLRHHPARFFNVVNTVLLTIINYHPKQVSFWVSIMTHITDDKISLAEFKAVGKVAAWMCGLSHLRQQSKEAYFTLSTTYKEKLANQNPINYSLEECLENPWIRRKRVELGGFIGFNKGAFRCPPIIFQYKEPMLVSDGHSVSAIFFDAFGEVLLHHVEAGDLDVYLDPITSNPQLPYSDITSSVVHKQGSVYTRSSSHHVFIQIGL